MLLEQTDPKENCLDPEETVEWIPALRAFASSLERNHAQAEDLVQETLLKAIRHREKFRPGTNLRAWLFTILRNSFYNGLVKTRREHPGDQDCVASQPGVAATQEWTIRGREVVAAVERLPTHYREMFVLVVMQGESYETSAAVCGVAMGTVKSRVNRARALIIADLGDGEV